MSRNFIAGLAAMLAVGLLAAMAARQSPGKRKGLRELVWPAPLRWFVLVMLPASLGIAWMASQAKPDQAVIAAIVSGFFVLGSFYLACCIFLYRVWWTNEGIGSWHLLAGGRFVAWDDVEEGRYVESLQAFYVRGGGTRVWYSPMQAGVATLHRFMERRLKPVGISAPEAPTGDSAG